jgi:hypothetical protein
MRSTSTQNQIEAFKLTADRLQNFLNADHEILGEIETSPYGFIIFCSFLVTAAYAPSKKFFPDTLVDRDEADTEAFRQIVVRSLMDSLLGLHERALNLSETEKNEQFIEIERQVVDLLEQQYTRYYGFFCRDVSRLAENRTNPYAELSESFLVDILGLQGTSESRLVKFKANLGLLLSTTISGLMSFFAKPEGTDR